LKQENERGEGVSQAEGCGRKDVGTKEKGKEKLKRQEKAKEK